MKPKPTQGCRIRGRFIFGELGKKEKDREENQNRPWARELLKKKKLFFFDFCKIFPGIKSKSAFFQLIFLIVLFVLFNLIFKLENLLVFEFTSKFLFKNSSKSI